MEIAYLCDCKKPCSTQPSCQDTCFHTLDINHAKNFTLTENGKYISDEYHKFVLLENGKYMEVENGSENG